MYSGRSAAESLASSGRVAGAGNDWCFAAPGGRGAHNVDRRLPPRAVRQGAVEGALPGHAAERLALLKLDTDWYESTLHEVQDLYPGRVRGGVLIIDDYNHWEGVRTAVDEYVARDPVLLQRIDYTGRLVVKTS
jgi:hypothetical protein